MMIRIAPQKAVFIKIEMMILKEKCGGEALIFSRDKIL
jgi:hypothetical protein